MRVLPLQGASINGQMKPTFIALLALCVAGCGKKEGPKSQDQAKAPSKPAVQNSQTGQPKAEAKKPGTVLWEFETEFWVDSSPAIGPDGIVYVGSWDDKVYALDGKIGAEKWEFKTGFGTRSSPAIGSDGTIYVGSEDNKIYALNGKSGAKKWEFETGFNVSSSPAIGSDGTVYVGSGDNKLYAINPNSGVKLWEF